MKDVATIKNNISEHRRMIEEIKRKGLYSAWRKYLDSLQEMEEVVKVDDIDFTNIEKTHGISLPAEIKYFYTEIGAKPSDFYYQVNRMKDNRDQIMLDYQYSEKLAYSIVETYCTSTVGEKELIGEEILSMDKEGLRKSYNSDLNYLLWEGISLYNKSENAFSLPFLQNVFMKLKSDPELIVEVFLTWVHCGGGGGIVLNTENRGFDGGLMFGSGLVVEFEGLGFDYYSNCHKERQEYHLVVYGGQIERNLSRLKTFAQQQYHNPYS